MIKPFHLKKALAWVFNLMHINHFLCYSQEKLFSPYIRAVYYHDISPSQMDAFEMQLRYFSSFFSVDEEDLSLFHKNIWNKNKPGLILTFDDGYRFAYEVVYPLLEKYGFKGWFFIPLGLIDIAADKQPKLINKHKNKA